MPIAGAYKRAREEEPDLRPGKHAKVEVTGVVCTADGPTKKARRAEEEQKVVGGLRNAAAAVNMVPGWDSVGQKLGSCVRACCVSSWPVLSQLLGQIGSVAPLTEDVQGEIDKAIGQLRIDIARDFNFDYNTEDSLKQGLQAKIFGGLLGAAGDPEVEVQKWMAGYTPVGINKDIIESGVFPVIEAKAVGPELDKLDALLAHSMDTRVNYKSFDDNETEANKLLKIEIDLCYAEWTKTKEELEAKYGTLVPSKVGCVVTEGKHGKKYRLIHDLRRSRVNALLKLKERLVLPRLADVVESLLDLRALLTVWMRSKG